MALGIGVFADALSGSWSTDICLDATPSFTTFTSTLVVNYEICGWTFGGTFGFGMGGWETVAFDVYGALGAFAIDSDIVFNPSTASFTSWENQVDLAIAGVDLTFEFDLYDTYSWWTISASGAAGLCNVGVVAQFGDVEGYCFCFDQIDFTFDFPFLCGTTVYVTAGFSTAGFDGITLTLGGLYFAELPWLTFEFSVTFTEGTEGGKSFTFVPAISLTDACDEDAGYISLFVELYSAGATFDGLNVYGIDIYKAFNGVWFQDLTSFEAGKNEEITGYAAYWEAIGIGTVGDSCCGGLFSFEVWTYFAQGSSWLFDWGLTTIDLAFGIGSNFDVTAGLQIDASGLLELCLGFAVSW
jgi:hypothetical protein